ncbi:beta-galactosidase [Streptomyces sp. AV19]|uniref:glycoside hydrolase family 35 protein n=1 Tax=Streptomyces sp. AV19 TaxID=2793068 RepID=UPI0018FE80A3|nr:beta-galactosidase family protein [Streptomyces sp. AV19]MBH1936325.1 beta-galactosidase [Streptomyces sp. AV19]MDG4532362.1 beta-galactosidase [Streptomyces sp. AV19]
MPQFTADDDGFRIDGRPVRLLSGALHYFRVHEGLWAHRLGMLRAMGLNCVETYVPWNRHEPAEGAVRGLDELGRFLDAAATAGLLAIVRPGPYICAEWENGGLPHWLTGRLGRRVRTRDPEFLRAADGWLRAVADEVVGRQADRGGPVVLVQVENEYGSYGSDGAYLRHLVRRLRASGVTVPLVTSDGPEDHMLSGGTVPGAIATVNFGSDARGAFATLRRHRPRGPLMCMELWCGWFSHWGGEAAARDAGTAAEVLREVLECGASVNVYMAHGGTSFGGWSGANRAGEEHSGALRPTVTSYDYDAPVDEYGRPTAKFHAFRDVLAGYATGPLPPVPPAPPVLGAPVRVPLDRWAPLGEVIDALGGAEAEGPLPPSFEELGVDRGVVRYRFALRGPRGPRPLRVRGLRDRAVAYVDGVRAAVLDTEEGLVGEVAGPAEVELWVESLGRVNYGPRLGETKGLTGGLTHGGAYVHGVRARGLRLAALEGADALATVPWRAVAGSGPGLYRGSCRVPEPGDAALELPGWERGFVWINGFCPGRYWSAGPQDTLYVPGPVLREGRNELVVLELERAGEPLARLDGDVR